MRIAVAVTIVTILIAMATAARPGLAQDLVKITEFPPVEGYLGDKAADGIWAERYDDRTYQFYSYSEMDLNYDETVVLDVLSYEYQPIIYLQDNQGQTLDVGTPIPSWVDANSQRRVYAAHLDYRSTYQGRLVVYPLHTSHHMTVDQNGNPVQSEISNIAQGRFYLSGSLWRPRDAPATPATPPGMSGGSCNCSDPATGRWYVGSTLGGLLDCPPPPPPDSPDWCQ